MRPTTIESDGICEWMLVMFCTSSKTWRKRNKKIEPGIGDLRRWDAGVGSGMGMGKRGRWGGRRTYDTAWQVEIAADMLVYVDYESGEDRVGEYWEEDRWYMC